MITRIDQLNELSELEPDLAFWVFSKNKKSVEYISPRVEKIFETNIDKISNIADFRRLVHPEDQMKTLRNLNGGNSDSVSEIDYRIITPKGKIKWLKNISIGIRENQNKTSTVIGCTYVNSNNKNGKQVFINEQTVLRSLPDSFIIIDTLGKIINGNISQTEKLILKDHKKAYIGKSIVSCLNTQLYKKIKEKIIEFTSTQTLSSCEVEMNREIQSEWFEIRMMKVNEDVILIIIRNITDMLTRINKVEKFYNITEQSQELIMITDVTGIIEYVNPKISETSGYSYTELIGKKASIFKSGKHDESFYSELWANILKGVSFKAEFHNLKKNGDYYIEEKIITPFSNMKGEITNFISTGRDVTIERRDEYKANKYKQLQVTIEEKEQKTRTLSLIKSHEIERKKFAKEIHEGLSQMLSAAMANLESLIAKKVVSSNEKAKIEFINQMVSEIINELRGISTNLSPISLYEFGLFQVIRQMANITNSKYNQLKIDFLSNISGMRFKNEVEINIYRIIQEAINNAINHSKATKIALEINYNNGILTLSIKDDGEGINMNNLEFKKMNTFGILNIEARAKSIGGILNIKSKKDKGFSIDLLINTKITNL